MLSQRYRDAFRGNVGIKRDNRKLSAGYKSRLTSEIGSEALFEFLQLLKALEDDLFARFFYLAREEDFVQDGVDFVEVKHEVEFADVFEEGVKNFYEEVDSFEISKLVIVCVDTDAEI